MKSEESNGDDGVVQKTVAASKKKPTIETIYQKKTQLEHILLRPDTYIGTMECTEEMMWIYDSDKSMMVQKEIKYVPGLYKIFDEILVNAADNKQRDKKMDCIKIDIDAETGTISVWNNGKGIPVTMHKEEKMFVPTMIFGHLLTSSNYNDEEMKVTGGRNGYGAKLCNIFSHKFTVETSSKEYKRYFKQTWGGNMSQASEPKLKDYSGEDFTKITFSPDLSKFKMKCLDDDIIGLMSRRAYDVAASTGGVKVYLNGKRLPVKNFKDYVDLYVKSREAEVDKPLKVVYESPNERWEIACTLSDRGLQQVSFVNSIATTKGGRHVDYVVDMLTKQLMETIKKKNKSGFTIKPFQLKNHLWIFINCLIVNPTFDSQTKENMTLQPKNFGSKCTLSDKFLASVCKLGIVEAVLSWATFKASDQLNKVGGKKQEKLRDIPKLDDANKAGTRYALQCTLILTEGDSAKSLVVSGLGVIGRDYYGVFPLRGKLLNVRDVTPKQLKDNQEISSLIRILGLKFNKKYDSESDMKTLRYGKVMIMTDQDQDGSHIKGLIINLIHHHWPDLLRQNFLEEFITPIVKATKKGQQFAFYSLPEFEEWKSNTANYKTFNIKYYKGLGTSESKEIREYFSNMDRHRIRFRYSGQQDDEHILLAFSKKHTDNRKEWLTNFMVESKRRKELGLPDRYLYTKNTRFVSYSDFINLELVLFSNADNVRSIPCMVDGFKPGQRKVLYTCFKRNDKREVKVAQLAGAVAEHSAYHHGEVSLCMTIVNLAQNFVGSNNINLLEPRGQFGSRLQGGKDAASARYIFTKLSPMARMIFHGSDDALLKSEYDDNRKIEPLWYIPVIPMVLVNGAEGIGTGWMTKVPNYNPREIVDNLRKLLAGDPIEPMKPWYKNFKGIIQEGGDQRYVTSGEVAIIGNDQIEINELPIGMWTQNYKENVLEALLPGAKKLKGQPVIADYKEYSTDTTVKFVVTLQPGVLPDVEREGLHKVFKLQNVINTSQLCAFDELGCLRKFNTVDEILEEFYVLRLKMYQKRKDYLEGYLQAVANKLSNQARFIVEKCSREIVVENKKRAVIIQELISKGYPPDPLNEWKLHHENDADEEEDEQGEDDKAERNVTDKSLTEGQKFDYILGLSMWTLTEERKNELLRQRDSKLEELNTLRRKTPSDLWREDLDALIKMLDEVEEKERQDEAAAVKAESKKTVKGKKKTLLSEALPSPLGRRILPTIGDDLKKRMQNAAKLKENKEKRGVKKEILDNDEESEFDLMVQSKKSLKDRLGTPEDVEKKVKSKKSLKQSKLNFKPVCNNKSSDDSDMEMPGKVAASKGKRKLATDSDSDDLFGNSSTFNKSKSDSDFEELIKETKKVKKEIVDDDSDSPKIKRIKSTQKKEPMAKTKKVSKKRIDYDSDEFDQINSDSDQSSAPIRTDRPERARKTAKYVFDSDENESN